jgi:galactose-1-phosphate uridylyltransferase
MDHNIHQATFDTLKNLDGWQQAFDWFHLKQLEEGFVNPLDLVINTLYMQRSEEYDLDFKVLINRVRDAYANTVVAKKDKLAKKYCPLCVEFIDKLGQHKKQAVYLSLNKRDYVLSLTPFPSFEKHLVLSLKQHQPMFMNDHTIEDLLDLQNKLGAGYSIVSNSDHAKTGASILDHHHVQVLGEAHFPVADAKVSHTEVIEQDGDQVLVEKLHFPATVVRLSAVSVEAVKQESKAFLQRWRAKEAGNTCNLWVRKYKARYEIYFILRHISYETDPSLFRYKTEGIGIIEMCGYGIFPTPKADTDLILKEIENNTAELMTRLLKSHAPGFP